MHTAQHRRAPTLRTSPRPQGPTPEQLVHMFLRRMPEMHVPSQPKTARGGIFRSDGAFGKAMDPEQWWRLYMLNTNVRGAGVMHTSQRKEAWAGTSESSRPSTAMDARGSMPRRDVFSPREQNGLSPSSRVRPAPRMPSQPPSHVHQQSSPRAQHQQAAQQWYPGYAPRIARPVHRAAPVVDKPSTPREDTDAPRRTMGMPTDAFKAEVQAAQRIIVSKLIDK